MPTLTLTSTSKSITAEVTGLQEESVVVRRFKWYLDGVLKFTEAVNPPLSARSYTYSPVYFASSHMAKVEIYDNETEELYYTDEDSISTLYPMITPWSWSASNGEATDAQTSNSYSSLISEGLVESFHWKVWNDFVNKVNEARVETGQAWKTDYASKVNTLVEGIYSELTVAKFNSVVQNIAYPFWNWAQLPGSPGYLGRLLMRGTATMGNNADDVYYQYIIELARKLNLVIGIYNNTGQLTPLVSALGIILATTGIIASAPPGALQTNHTIDLYGYNQIVLVPTQALSSQLHAAISGAGLIDTLPPAALNGSTSALLTIYAYPASAPPTVLESIPLLASLATAGNLDYVQMTFITAVAAFSLNLVGLLNSNGQKTLMQGSAASTLSSAAEAISRPPTGLAASIEAFLSASVLIDNAVGRSVITDLQITLGATAVLETEAVVTWEYPVQTGEELYITQIYSASQTGNTLSLE